MTTTDKTGEQPAQHSGKTEATGATRGRTATPRSSAKSKPAAMQTTRTAAADPYRYGRRVWPD